MDRATSSGVTTRPSGVCAALRAISAGSRPATNCVSTAAGDTLSTRMPEPKARASDSVMVSSAALAAQYAMLLPSPVKADTEDTFTTTASPDARSSGSSARVMA